MSEISQLGPSLSPPVPDENPPLPAKGRLVTPELLFLNQATTYKLGSAFAGISNPSVVWQQMIDNQPTAMMYYRELEEKDDDVGDAIAEMKLSVMKRGWQITPGDDSQMALDAADFMRKQLEGLPDWRNSLDNILDAPFYGYTVAEQIFDTSMGQAGLQDIVDCPQELFCFAPFTYPQIGQLRLKPIAGSPDGAPVNEAKFITSSSRSRHGNRMGRPLLRSVYWASWFKRNNMRFWLRLAERGPGTAVVTHKDGATDDERRQALEAAEALISEVAVAVPESFSVLEELLKGTRAADPKTYESLHSMLESKIYRRIVGGTLTSHGSDGGKGTQALGKVHQDTKDDRSIELCLATAQVINRQVIRNMVLWNFGPKCPLPVFSFIIADEADLGKDVTTVDTLQQMGLEIPKKYVYEHFAVPQPVDDEPLLVRAIAPPTAITTPAGSPDHPQFSESQQRQVDADKQELDVLFGQLRKEALKETAKQLGVIADNIERSGAGTRGR